MLDGSDASLSLRVALVLAGVVSALFLKSRLNYLSIPRLLAIPKLRKAPEACSPDCMVVIPARNEERSIARAIRSFPHDSVIVVDDHSEDRTAQVAREAGAGVVYAPDLPRGAVGKSNACMAGARVLMSKWIFFADADTSFELGFLDAAVAHAEAGDLAFLSIYPRAEGETFRNVCWLLSRRRCIFVDWRGVMRRRFSTVKASWFVATRMNLWAGMPRSCIT